MQHGEAFLEMLPPSNNGFSHVLHGEISQERDACLLDYIAPKKARETKMIFTKRGYERAWNFGERQRNCEFLSVHINMITLQKDPKEHFNLCMQF